MALHLGCISLFNEIINTCNIYLANKTTTGMWEHLSYDITEYENCKAKEVRRGRSPLLLPSFADKMIAFKQTSYSHIPKWNVTQVDQLQTDNELCIHPYFGLY